MVVVLLRSGSEGFVRSVEVDEARALLASVLRASPGGGGRGCSVGDFRLIHLCREGGGNHVVK